ncbi:MAG: NAD(P)H-hydrate dehydratase [Bacteroidetes bacterium]|nr:NAD(P)H-hydrate dehydratase [Bacteroidota bacterium]
MQILSASQIKQADQDTITNEPISSIDLMERAAEKCCEFFPPVGKWNYLVVICGTGNNGGDGLAIARLQLGNFKSVRVLILKTGKQTSENFEINLKKLQDENVNIQFITDANDIFLSDEELVVDAILGVGITRPVDGFISDCIDVINELAVFVISIDLPSGLIADSFSSGKAIKANLTLTIGAPKQILFFSESSEFVGEWKLVDIYKNEASVSSYEDAPQIVDLSYARKHYKVRPEFSHKGTFGKALIVAGGQGKYGAAVLTARACMRSGIGLLTVQVPNEATMLIHSSLPEALLKPDRHQTMITEIMDVDLYDSIGIGPGIGTANETVDGLIQLIKEQQKPIVIDADALNIISEHPDLLTKLPLNSILTPHPKEFERLFGPTENSFERLEKQKTQSAIHKIIIICKGRYTTITTPEGKVFFNMSGNSGLAKGGSGDVLTGIITSLLAQGYSPESAAVFGVFVHGYSADLLADKIGKAGILPGDVIENLPYIFKVFEA